MSALSFGPAFPSAPEHRPMPNLGCLFDIPTGQYQIGKSGESILNGGMAHITGIGGRGNVGKSLVARFQNLTVLDRLSDSVSMLYDTEISAGMARTHQLAQRFDNLGGVDLKRTGRFLLTAGDVMIGDKWYDEVRKYAENKQKAPDKEVKRTTPFLDDEGKPYKSYVPSNIEIDSLSQFTTSVVEDMQDKNTIGSSGRNMEAIRGAGNKYQMLNEFPTLTASAGINMILTAHVDDNITLDPYAPVIQKLAFLKSSLKFKRVPNNYFFLTNNLWYCYGTQPLRNPKLKTPEFPRDSYDDNPDSTDLQEMTLQNLRGKYGPTGSPFHLLVSQTQGVLRGLSEFYYCKSFEASTADTFRFGLQGHDKSYRLALCPDVNLQRTTVRSKIDSTPELQRGFEITSELAQMRHVAYDQYQELWCPPETLYADLVKQGYKWEDLLQTRGYWVFEEQKHPKHFLSTMDLLRMRAGLYKPYWM